MEIVVGVKPAPEPESRLRPASDGRTLDPDGVKWTLQGYDESAVEQALLLKEAVPGSRVRAVTVGAAGRGEEVLRAALALGCDAATLVELPPGIEPDALDVARALALAVERAPAELVLLGKQSADREEGVLPLALAARLGRPGFSSVVDLRWEAAAKEFRFQRVVESGTESWSAPAPLVVGLQQAWNDPRTAKLQNILKSRKAPIDRVPAAEVAAALGTRARARAEAFRLPPPRTGARMIEFETPAQAAEKLVKLLREEAKVFP
jgi:electron transfer flavoprotein beta subunit